MVLRMPTLVLLGSRSCLSVSGRDYLPHDEPVGDHNLVTVDLSPCEGIVWGDCARSFAVEGGQVVSHPSCVEFAEGFEVQARLHAAMCQHVTPGMSFHDLHEFTNGLIASEGFENLDFLGNVGHSIATRRCDRLFIEPGNHQKLGGVPCFTFEPHIRRAKGVWGFKHENIYCFDTHGKAKEL